MSSLLLVSLVSALSPGQLPEAKDVKIVKLFEVPHYCEGIVFDHEGNGYISHGEDITKFTPDGKPLGAWGRPGRQPGELYNPWGLCVDRHDRVHVVDTYNYRVQRIVL